MIKATPHRLSHATDDTEDVDAGNGASSHIHTSASLLTAVLAVVALTSSE